MSLINSYILKAINFVNTGFVYPDLALKSQIIFQGLIFIAVFSMLFFYFYHKNFWQDNFARRLFWLTIFSLAIIFAAKYLIFIFWRGYIPDRLLFYAVPSPKFDSFNWLIAFVSSILFFWKFKYQSIYWPQWKFFTWLFLIFVLFSTALAGLREGTYGIYEPFTRSYWEYIGNLPLVKNIPDFLHNYISLNPKLAIHSITHPPGYTLVLYILKELFKVDVLGLSILVVILGGLVILPLYYLFKYFASEIEVRRGLQLFIFFPGVALMSATSMDFILPFLVWLTIFLFHEGWRKSPIVSLIAGVVAAIMLLMNYLVLLLGPLFAALFLWIYFQIKESEHRLAILRLFLSCISFTATFLLIYYFTGYSIVENFFVARHANSEWVASNFESIGLYLTFLFINIAAFSIYLGIPNLLAFFRSIPYFSIKDNLPLAIGFVMAAFFIFIGIFQGEVERIWLFLTPLFILPFVKAIKSATIFSAVVSLLIFQIVSTQILFYTFW